MLASIRRSPAIDGRGTSSIGPFASRIRRGVRVNGAFSRSGRTVAATPRAFLACTRRVLRARRRMPRVKRAVLRPTIPVMTGRATVRALPRPIQALPGRVLRLLVRLNRVDGRSSRPLGMVLRLPVPMRARTRRVQGVPRRLPAIPRRVLRVTCSRDAIPLGVAARRGQAPARRRARKERPRVMQVGISRAPEVGGQCPREIGDGERRKGRCDSVRHHGQPLQQPPCQPAARAKCSISRSRRPARPRETRGGRGFPALSR